MLTSPGLGTLEGYLTASPVVANNIAQRGLVAVPVAFQRFGGGTGFGSFGAGAISLTSTHVAFSLVDTAPGGGRPSCAIASWKADFK